MSVKNVLTSCDDGFGNTGYGDCFTDFEAPAAIISVPKGWTGDATSVATIKTALEALVIANVASQRGYPVFAFVDSDNSEDDVYQTFPNGAIRKVRDGNYDLTLRWLDGGFCLLYSLIQSQSAKNRPFLIVTKDGKLVGTDGGADLIAGIKPTLININKMKWNDGQNTSAYTMRINWTPSQTNKNIAFVDFSDDGGLGYFENSIAGLQNVTILQGAARASNVVKVKLTTSCGTVNLYDLFATELAATAAFAPVRTSTGNALTLTSVAGDANIKGFTLTFDATDPDYSATAGQLTIKLAGPATLDGLGVSGYEGGVLLQ